MVWFWVFGVEDKSGNSGVIMHESEDGGWDNRQQMNHEYSGEGESEGVRSKGFSLIKSIRLEVEVKLFVELNVSGTGTGIVR